MTKKAGFVTVIAALGVGGLLAQSAAALENDDLRFDTTADLYAVCSVKADAAEFPVTHQACRAFIEASVQYHDEITGRKQLKRLICYPPTATIGEGKQIFVAWAAAHAGDKKLMAEQPVVGLVRALAAKYPCKR